MSGDIIDPCVSEIDIPGVRIIETRDGSQKCGFTTPTWTEEGKKSPSSIRILTSSTAFNCPNFLVILRNDTNIDIPHLFNFHPEMVLFRNLYVNLPGLFVRRTLVPLRAIS